MPINSTEVSYGFGQMGSAHSQEADNTVTPPAKKIIVAIQFLDSCSLSALVPEQMYGVDTYVGTGTTANTAGNSEVFDTSVVFPKGITIYGRWSSVSLHTDNSNGIICYFGE